MNDHGLKRALATLICAFFSLKALPLHFILLLTLSVAAVIKYQNHLCGAVAILVSLHTLLCRYYERRNGNSTDTFKVVAFGLPMFLLLPANFLLMDITAGRAAIIERFFGGTQTMIGALEPRLFLPTFDKITYYKLNFEIITDCQDQLKSADGKETIALEISLPLEIIPEDEALRQFHKSADQKILEVLLERLVCEASANMVKNFASVLAFGQGVRLKSEEALGNLTIGPMSLDQALRIFGVRRQTNPPGQLYIKPLMKIRL